MLSAGCRLASYHRCTPGLSMLMVIKCLTTLCALAPPPPPLSSYLAFWKCNN